MTNTEQRVADLIRTAFRGVTLGNGVGLRQARGLDDYADSETLAKYRAEDEKKDWSRIPASELNRYGDSLSFFDPEGMRFHLPAYLIADLEGMLTCEVVFHLTYDYGMSRFSEFTTIQRNAVREFLLLRLSDSKREPGPERPEIEMIEKALAEYWTVPEPT